MPRGFDSLTPLDEARAALLAACAPVASTRVPAAQATGRIVDVAIAAAQALPPRAIAMRDGWAVGARDTVGASSYSPGFAAHPPPWLLAGQALPPGADAVLPPHAVLVGQGPAQILATVAPGEDIRRPGGDFEISQLIVAAGDKLRPDHVALLDMAGIESVDVRVARVTILASRGAAAATSGWIAAMNEAQGARANVQVFDTPNVATLQAALAQAAADLILVICPSGFAGSDQIGQAVAQSGTLLARGLAVRPGEAMGCGILQSSQDHATVPVILVPDRIEEAFAAWYMLVRPCLRHMQGTGQVCRGETRALTRKIVSNPGFCDLVILRRAGAGEKPMWAPLATGDIPWSTLAAGEAWLAVSAASEGYAGGEPVFAEFL